jgi:hypothetical protein
MLSYRHLADNIELRFMRLTAHVPVAAAARWLRWRRAAV